MAFKPRNNKPPTITEKPKQVVDNSVIVGGLLNTKSDSRTPAEREAASFREQAKNVLDILEKTGVDFYDENRSGGMYLNNRKKSSIFKTVNKQEVDNQKNSFLQKMLNK